MSIASLYAGIAQSWSSASSSFLDLAASKVGTGTAEFGLFMLATQSTYHATFWPLWLGHDAIRHNPRFDRYKIHPGEWDTPEIEERAWKLVVNYKWPIYTARAFAMQYFLFFSKGRMSLTATSSSPLVALRNLAIVYVTTDFVNYCWHITCHKIPALYQGVHKFHHQYTVIDYKAHQFDHWFEPLIFFVGSGIGVLISGMSLLEYLAFWPIFTIADLHVHCGYRFPYNPLNLLVAPEMHDWHHYQNVGNYGNWTPIWDWLFGTDKAWRASIERSKEGKEGEKEE